MATAIPVCRTARQAKRAGPDLEAGPEASAERSEGTMEARQGRDAAGGSMRSTTARPAVSWPGTPGSPEIPESQSLDEDSGKAQQKKGAEAPFVTASHVRRRPSSEDRR